jgi:hypothetical protein
VRPAARYREADTSLSGRPAGLRRDGDRCLASVKTRSPLPGALSGAGLDLERHVEFVGFGEVWPELKSRGVIEARRDANSLELAIDPSRSPVTVELCSGDEQAERPGKRKASVDASAGLHAGMQVRCPAERVATALETVLHKLHLTPLYLVPVGLWRNIFDVVSFGLATNESWQEIDSQASVQQNTRDPILCGPRDLHTLRELVRVLLADGQADAQASFHRGLSIVGSGQSLIAHVEPTKPVRIVVASVSVAEQIRDAAVHFLSGAAQGGRGPNPPQAQHG